MDNREHQKDCICAWCEVEKQNAEMREAKEKADDRLAGTPCCASLIIHDPADLHQSEILAKMPAFFRAIRGQEYDENDLKEMIEGVRKLHQRMAMVGGSTPHDLCITHKSSYRP